MSVEVGRIIEKFLQGPLGREARAQDAREILEARHRAATRLAKMEEEGAARAKVHAASVSTAKAAYDASKGALEKAIRSLGELQARSLAESWRYQSEMADLLRMLEQTSAPELDQFIEEARLAIDSGQMHAISSMVVGIESRLYGSPVRIIATNSKSLCEFLDEARGILAEAKQLRLVPDQTSALSEINVFRRRLADAWHSIRIEHLTIEPMTVLPEKKP